MSTLCQELLGEQEENREVGVMATLCPPSKEGLSGTLRSGEDFIKVCLLLLIGVPTEPSSPYPTKGKESKKGHFIFYYIVHQTF